MRYLCPINNETPKGTKKFPVMKITISNIQVEVKQVADFMSQMDSGCNDTGKYENLILSSEEKQRWIQENFSAKTDFGKLFLDVNMNEAFKVIEA